MMVIIERVASPGWSEEKGNDGWVLASTRTVGKIFSPLVSGDPHGRLSPVASLRLQRPNASTP